ncbi:hypothetical protein FHW68_003519 [Pseudomonas sp. Tn43]|uniref:hypothetical protein n=1 Tax=unclassified Pseudomonas TaxID=196821 RepID=UPI000BABC972|nr:MULTISPECIES: hypothetical protein [unclassified Pseudomonas]MBB3241982.1 hypothetical protein [Pseudomonas sp. Tn43]PAU58535.1 hypothetical protein BZL43_12235 [Pseudomonas sp. PICF141]
MTIPDSRTGQPDGPRDSAGSEQNFQHIKEEVTEAIGGARHQADEQFGQYRDTAADQIEALARGAQSVVSEIRTNDTFGMSDYLANMADSMSSLAGKLRSKSAEELLHDGADLARDNPGLFIVGSIAVGFGLSRFLKAGTAASPTTDHEFTDQSSTSSFSGDGSQEFYETSMPSAGDLSPGLATGITPSSPNAPDHRGDTSSMPGSSPFTGER